MDPIVINISSGKLLEIIMKDDHEAILKIKKGVLDNWANKNIRPRIDQGIANQLISDMDTKIRTTIRDTVKEHFKYEELEPYVREQTVKIINKMIDEELGSLIQTRVQEIIAKQLKKIK